MKPITAEIRRFIDAQRVARFATADGNGQPHVVPVCYCLLQQDFYFSIDDKPKRTKTGLRRIRNIEQNARVSVVIDHYEDDWQRLGWVMLNGRAEILLDGDEHDSAQSALMERYPQLRQMDIAGLPVIVTRVENVRHWGRLQA